MTSSRVRLKMCGMTNIIDAQYAVSIGVDAIGVICYPKSPRYVPCAAMKFLENLGPFVDIVAVFVNPLASEVREVLRAAKIQYLQFHGDESPAFCEQFGVPYIKSVQAQSSDVILQAFKEYSKASAILLETPQISGFGGSGLSFDWYVIPKQLPKPMILAGGLQVQNVLEAITVCQPYALDVCSGVELSPGVKDHDKMRDFMKQVWNKA